MSNHLNFFSHSVGYLSETEETVYEFENHYVVKRNNVAVTVDDEAIEFYDKEPETIYYNKIVPEWWEDLYTDGAGNCFSDADSGL